MQDVCKYIKLTILAAPAHSAVVLSPPSPHFSFVPLARWSSNRTLSKAIARKLAGRDLFALRTSFQTSSRRFKQASLDLVPVLRPSHHFSASRALMLLQFELLSLLLVGITLSAQALPLPSHWSRLERRDGATICPGVVLRTAHRKVCLKNNAMSKSYRFQGENLVSDKLPKAPAPEDQCGE